MCNRLPRVRRRARRLAWYASDKDVNFKPPLGELAIDEGTAVTLADDALTVATAGGTLIVRAGGPSVQLGDWEAAVQAHRG